MKEISWKTNHFTELTANELYSILHLRCQVFVVEQATPYLDPDNKDQKALHLQGFINDKLVAYCRLFKSGDYFEEASIGRVVVEEAYRKYGLGHELIKKAIEIGSTVLNETDIVISAQLYLQPFYESHGFCCTSEVYLEDGIPHIQMKLS